MKRILLVFLVVATLALAACQQSIVGDVTGNASGNVTTPATGDNLITGGMPVAQPSQPVTQGEQVPAAPEKPYTITKTEGDLIILAPEAVDPDGDAVSYSFTKPFDTQGRWQTNYGDAGNYTVIVTATDSKGASTSTPVLVVVQRANRPPSVRCPENLVVKETDTVSIDCVVSDPDNDTVTLTYTGWMTSQNYTTTYDDSGTHLVTVTASDGHGHTVVSDVNVTVQDVNRPPVFPLDFPTKIVAQEGDVVAISTGDVYDPDGNKVTFTFSTPFDSNGVWKTKIGDAGTYPVDVVASDGSTSVTKRVTVVINMVNTAPVLKRIPDITVNEGDTITLPLDATDREGDKLTYTVSGWMNSSTYTTNYNDAGSYTVKVTVSDGQLSDSQIVHITVLDVNRAPVFKVPA